MTEFVLTTEYAKRLAARAIPGAMWDANARQWVVQDPSPRAAAAISRIFPAVFAANPELQQIAAELLANAGPRDYAAEAGLEIDARGARTALSGHGIIPMGYQSRDAGYLAEVLRRFGGAYLAHERGLGKTITSLLIADQLKASRVLVVCPNTAKSAVWLPEIERTTPWLRPVVIRNGKSQRERDVADVTTAYSIVFVVHYEALKLVNWRSMPPWDLVIVDEAHRLANPKTQMFKAIKTVPRKASLALSGSVISNSLEDMFGQLQFLYPKVYKSRWRDWNDKYIDYVDSGWGRVAIGPKLESLDELTDELGRIMAFRRSADVLDLPDKREQEMFVDLKPAQQRVYNDLVKTAMAEITEDETVFASSALSLLTRLRQVASGLDLVSSQVADSAKIDLAFDLIVDDPQPVVVFGLFRASLAALEARLAKAGIESFRVDGDVKQAARAEMIDQFQAGHRRVFMGTIATLGESVTLTRASHAIFLDRPWNPAALEQSRDRIYRIGQQNKVLLTTIIARGTVDESRVTPVLKAKEDVKALVFGKGKS